MDLFDRVRLFFDLEVREAEAWAAQGGQALHVHRVIVSRERAPSCFVRAVDRGEHIAHLVDRDKDRLARTARGLGVRVIYIDREGEPFQHIDLCGSPLRKCRGLLDAESLKKLAESGRALP